MDKNIDRRYVVVYTLLFAAVAAVVFFPFALAGKSLIGNGDGQSQYILQLEYMGRWLREAFRSLLRGESIYHYDFTIGMGDDINAIVHFHPLELLSVFVRPANTETFYDILIILRFYLAGLAFSLYAFHFSPRQICVLTGSIVYIFSGFPMLLGIAHPIYMSHVILLPLILLGAENIFDEQALIHVIRKEKGIPGEKTGTMCSAKVCSQDVVSFRNVKECSALILKKRGRHGAVLLELSVCLGFIANYYLMYITSIGLLIYVLVRFPFVFRINRAKNFLKLFFCMIGAYLLGLLMSGVVLFPFIMRYLQSFRSGRIASAGNLLVFSDVRRYVAWFFNLICPLEASGNGTHLNYTVIVLPALVVLLTLKPVTSQAKQLEIFCAIILAILLIPAGGFVMAVMSRENNRWVYLIDLVLACVAMFMMDRVTRLTLCQRNALVLLVIFYDLGTAALCSFGQGSIYHICGAIQLTVCIGIILVAVGGKNRAAQNNGTALRNRVAQNNRTTQNIRVAQTGKKELYLIMCITVFSACVNGYFTYGKLFGNYTRYYGQAGSAMSFFMDSEYANYTAVGGQGEGENALWEDGFYRVDGTWIPSSEDNASVILGYPGVQIYNSIINSSQVSDLLDTGNIGLTTLLHIHSLDGRTAEEEIAGVRYFQIQSGTQVELPFGYSDVSVYSVGDMEIYENEYPLSFGFTTRSVLGLSEYEQLDEAAKSEAKLSYAIISDESAIEAAQAGLSDVYENPGIEYEEISLPEGTDVIERNDSGYFVKEEKGELTFNISRREGYDLMLEFDSLEVTDMATSLWVIGDGIRKKITLLGTDQTYTTGRENYLVSLGYTGEGEGTLRTYTVRFTDKGQYNISSIRLVYVPREDYADKISQLNTDTLQDITFGRDKVTGTITLSDPAYMVFQIPYSTGWKLLVNGEEASLDRADGSYMGVLLYSGENEICLIYTTPGSFAGMCMTVVGVFLFVLVLMLRRRAKWNDASRD